MRQPSGRSRKRSLTLAGHATSVTLEEAFWRVLERLAAEEGQSLAGLVARIDRERLSGKEDAFERAPNLSSALRVYALERLAERASF